MGVLRLPRPYHRPDWRWMVGATCKANVNAKANNGVTPLHVPSSEGHKAVMELLLACKADVNSKANNDVTPLHLAAGHDRAAVAEVLLVHKADVNAKDNNGATPLHYAAVNDHAVVFSGVTGKRVLPAERS